MFEFNYGWRILKGRKLHTFISLIGLKHVRIHIIWKKIFHENFHSWSPQYYIMQYKERPWEWLYNIHIFEGPSNCYVS
jgi:hypothetical protein